MTKNKIGEVTRFEIIDSRNDEPRQVIKYPGDDSLTVEWSLQDEGRTLKVFLLPALAPPILEDEGEIVSVAAAPKRTW